MSRKAKVRDKLLLFAWLSAMTSGGIAVESPSIGGCPSSPNCVSSLAQDEDHRVGPVPFDGTPEEAWAILKRAIGAEPRTRIVEENRDGWYLRAEATSLVFRFVDDLEFQLIPEQRVVHLRSASRVGYWDLGVNRRRVQRLREALRNLGMWR